MSYAATNRHNDRKESKFFQVPLRTSIYPEAIRALGEKSKSILFVERLVEPEGERCRAWRGHGQIARRDLAAGARKPEGPGGFAPTSVCPVLHVAPLRAATVHLILSQIRLGRMVPIYRPTL